MNKKIIASVLAVAFAFSMAGPVGAITDAEYQTLVNQLADLTALYNTLLSQTSAPATSATAVCFDADLQKGMTSDSVKDLQIKLGVTPTSGYFGPITLAAVKTFQTSNGIINTGYVGPLTRGALNALYCTPVTPVTPVVPATTYPAGCTSAVGFSITTGLACSGEVVSYPAGCTSAVGFSPTTGLSCAGTTTTTIAAPSYGTLSVVSYPVSNPQTTLYGGITYEAAAGQYKATGSDIIIRKIPIEIISTDATVFPWQAFTAVSIWDGSTMLVSVPVTQANLIENTFAKDYTLDISGLSISIPKTTQKVLTVKVDAITNAVAAVTGTTFTVRILYTGVVNMDTAGVTYTSASGANIDSSLLTLSAAQAATITTTAATDNPLAGNIIGSKTATTKVDLLKFNVKVENVNATFNSGSATLTDGNSRVTSLELWDGSTLIASDAPDGSHVIAWSNFTLPISAGTTKTLTLKANLIQFASTYAGGNSVSVSTGPILTGIDTNSNVVSAAGSTVTGNTQYIYIEAPIFTYVSSSATVKGTGQSNLSNIGDTAIVFSVTANGGDIYIPQVGNSTTTLGMDELLTGGTATTSTSTTWTCSSPAVSVADTDSVAAQLWRVPSGSTANCTFSTLVTNTAGTAGYFSVALEHAKWYTTATSTAASYINQSWGLTNIKTADFHLGI